MRHTVNSENASITADCCSLGQLRYTQQSRSLSSAVKDRNLWKVGSTMSRFDR